NGFSCLRGFVVGIPQIVVEHPRPQSLRTRGFVGGYRLLKVALGVSLISLLKEVRRGFRVGRDTHDATDDHRQRPVSYAIHLISFSNAAINSWKDVAETRTSSGRT